MASHAKRDAAALLAAWTEALTAAGLSGETRRAYVSDVARFVDQLADADPRPIQAAVDAAPRALARAWLASLAADGRGPRGVKRALSALRSFYRWREQASGVDASAVLSLRGPRVGRLLPRPVATPAALALSREAPADWVGLRDRAVFALLYGAGLRISEALALRWSDAPLGADLIVLGKGGRRRSVPIAPPIASAVAVYASALPRRLSGALRPIDALFRGVKGGPLRAPVLRRALAARRAALGLGPEATPHALRHSFATDLLREGGDLRSVQELLGHASLASTQIYTAIDQDRVGYVFDAAHPRGAAHADRRRDGGRDL